MKFQLFIEMKMLKIDFLAEKFTDMFIMLIDVKMPTIVGILTFMSRIISKLHAQLSMIFYNHIFYIFISY